MMDLSDNRDPVLAKRRLAALIREHDYWMAGANCLDASGACGHVVRMPDGSLLNRYWDARDTPRDESWREDRETAAKAAPRPATVVQRDLRAAADPARFVGRAPQQVLEFLEESVAPWLARERAGVELDEVRV